jgi:hypothetical protein
LPLDRDEVIKAALEAGQTGAQAETTWRKRLEQRGQHKAGHIDPSFVGIMLEAIDKRDAKFFADAAAALRKIARDGTIIPDDREERALASFVGAALRKNPARTFRLAELLDSVKWRGPAPSERNLKRLCAKLGVPQPRGRPSKK